MSESAVNDLSSPRQVLLKIKFGRFMNWTQPPIVETVGPFTPQVFEEFDRIRREFVDQAAGKLDSYTPEEIVALVEKRRDNAALASSWRDFLDAEISKLHRNEPPWYAGGFGHPDYEAEFDYWCKMSSFSIKELACLSIGVEPRHLNAELDQTNPKVEDFTKLRLPIQFLLRRYEQLARKFDPQHHSWSVRPLDFLNWASRVEFQAHPEFVRLLERYHHGPESAEDAALGVPKPDKREIDKIAQLFTVMAMDYLGYVPKQARSPTPREIVEIAAKLGLEISDDTVRKYLRIGTSFLPEDRIPE